MIEYLIGIYVIGAIFILGFGISDQINFTNPDWELVAMATIGWPLLFLYAIWNGAIVDN